MKIKQMDLIGKFDPNGTAALRSTAGGRFRESLMRPTTRGATGKTHYHSNGNINDGIAVCGHGGGSWSLDPHATTCGHCLRSKAYPFAERKAAKVAPTLPRAVRELLRDVVLRRAWYAGAINDCPASSGEMADRAAKLLGTTREDIVRRAKAKR